jgi:phage shock protein PspC (stress-responsive transcriptional regulator)
MQNQPSLLARDDTFLGVCQGLGEDLGIPPTLLRLAGAGLLFWNPPAAVAAYAGLGVVVTATRWLCPDPAPSAEPAPVAGEAEAEAEPVALAA